MLQHDLKKIDLIKFCCCNLISFVSFVSHAVSIAESFCYEHFCMLFLFVFLFVF